MYQSSLPEIAEDIIISILYSTNYILSLIFRPTINFCVWCEGGITCFVSFFSYGNIHLFRTFYLKDCSSPTTLQSPLCCKSGVHLCVGQLLSFLCYSTEVFLYLYTNTRVPQLPDLIISLDPQWRHPPTLLFWPKSVLDIRGPLHFHINLESACQVTYTRTHTHTHTHNLSGMFFEMALNV